MYVYIYLYRERDSTTSISPFTPSTTLTSKPFTKTVGVTCTPRTRWNFTAHFRCCVTCLLVKTQDEPWKNDGKTMGKWWFCRIFGIIGIYQRKMVVEWWFFMGFYGILLSGTWLHNYGKIHHFEWNKSRTFDWAMAAIAMFVYQRVATKKGWWWLVMAGVSGSHPGQSQYRIIYPLVICYHLLMTNRAMENPLFLWRFLWKNPL